MIIGIRRQHRRDIYQLFHAIFYDDFLDMLFEKSVWRDEFEIVFFFAKDQNKRCLILNLLFLEFIWYFMKTMFRKIGQKRLNKRLNDFIKIIELKKFSTDLFFNNFKQIYSGKSLAILSNI